MKAWRDDLLEEVRGVNAAEFQHIITTTTRVPSIDDPAITYPNLVDATQRSKLLESAVLFVDLRNSTAISLKHSQEKLTALYSAYVRAMTRCAHYFTGHVRNIIGDRVMVVFDRENCYANAIHTATLMHSVSEYLLNREVPGVTIKSGIGIDFGQMLISKTGIVKRGTENTANKSLVWLGKPANVASKLTDMANKPKSAPQRMIQEGHYYDSLGEWGWYTYSVDDFLDHLTVSLGQIKHNSDYFQAFIKMESTPPVNPPILMTKYFYDGLKREHPELKEIKENFWTEQSLSVPGYSGKIHGGHAFYPDIKDY